MVSMLSKRFGSMRTVRHALAAILMIFSSAAVAQTSSDYAVVDNVTIYYAVLPAEMLRTFPPSSEEARMHGGVPGGKHVHHLQIAIFDAKTGARIIGARVTAAIAEIGLGSAKLELEPFQVGDVQTYGGYFEFQKRNLYEIRIRAELPGDGRVIENTFEYRHQ